MHIRKMLLIISVFLIFSLVTIFSFNNMDNKEKNIISNVEKDKQVINSNMITMMYETDAGTGEYVETKDNTWPESGYIFNDTLSGCENGGELEYNSENNTVNLLSNKSDRCYVYFDKYDGVWIDNVSITNVTGSSVTLSVSATSENGNITKYYYSLNDNEEYQEVTSNVITINDLNKLTEYKISIYAIDNTNAKSNIYEVSVSTTDISVPVINSVEVSNVDLFGFTLTVNATSENEISKYYYIIDSEDIAGITSENNYTFDNLNYGTTYKVKIYVVDIQDNISKEYIVTIETQNPRLFIDWIIAQYNNIQGTNGIYYHTSSLANSAGDNSYRYSGSNPNNYVCFGSEASVCPEDNLYRIVGVFGSEVKLIKSTSYGNYAWNFDSTNTWIGSNIENMLNTTYLNSLDSDWQEKISTHKWYVGGYSTNSATPKTFYIAESSGTSWNGEIGLMYVSDYGYAASPEYWTTTVNNYNTAVNSNWLFQGMIWTITHDTSISYNHFRTGPSGSIDWSGNGYISTSNEVFPTFYLKLTVQYIDGSGTQSDPIRIN